MPADISKRAFKLTNHPEMNATEKINEQEKIRDSSSTKRSLEKEEEKRRKKSFVVVTHLDNQISSQSYPVR